MILDEIRNQGSNASPSRLIDAVDHGSRVVDAVLAALALFAREHAAPAPEVIVETEAMLQLAQLGREAAECVAANANHLFDLHRRAEGITVDPAATRMVADAERAVRAACSREAQP